MKVRPANRRGIETVQRILDAACVLFARQGVRTTTLDEIGRLSGTGRGQLYHFFADKSDLVSDVIAQQVERVLEAQQPLLGSISTAADVDAWCREAVAIYEHGDDPMRCPIGSLVHELAEGDTAARLALADGFSRWRELLAEGLRRVDAAGELATGADPDAFAAALLASYEGGVLIAQATGSVEILRQALRAISSAALAESEGA